jgi:hypothetical protein
VKREFDTSNRVTGSYMLGAHTMWIERATGVPKGKSGLSYSIEIACSLLNKVAVCWMVMAADDASLATFDQAPVTLEADPPTALIPATALPKQPN